MRSGLGCDVNRLSYPQIYDVVTDPGNSNKVYMAAVAAPGPPADLRSGHGGFYRSPDGGATWSSRNPTAAGGGMVMHFDVFRSNPNIVYANDDRAKRVYRSSDAGLTWTVTNVSSFGPLNIHPTNSAAFITSSFTKLIKSTDSGNTGVTVADSDPTGNAPQMKPQFLDVEYSLTNPLVVYAIAKGYTVWKSTDGGSSFVPVIDFHTLLWP